jgi:FkbM family methyltransferase
MDRAASSVCPRHLPPLASPWWSSLDNCTLLQCFAVGGGCPAGAWKDATAFDVAGLAADDEPLVLVNAGANKGYAVAEFVQRFGDAEYSARQWLSNLTNIKANMMLPCGFCGACRAPAPTARPRPRGGIHAHAFELLPSNVMVLREMFQRMSVPGTVHALALSNYSGEAYRCREPTPECVSHCICDASGRVSAAARRFRSSVFRTGEEDIGASTTRNRHSVSTPCIALDEWSVQSKVRRVHVLSLDAEGWDMRILRGASRLLRTRRIGLVEFEWTPEKYATAEGLWGAPSAAGTARRETDDVNPLVVAARELAKTVGWLQSFGYECFFQGGEATPVLLRVTQHSLEACGQRLGTAVRHSNLVCAHAPALVARLRSQSRWLKTTPYLYRWSSDDLVDS